LPPPTASVGLLLLPPPPLPLSGCFGSSGALTSGTAGTVGVGGTVGTGVGVATGPRSTTDWAGAGRPGICTEETDAPGGTSTVVVMTSPVTRVTCTRWISAEAEVTSTTA
jgi:hypothetical protein